ncbi:Reverse transcriptase precursor [Phytophthora megakarya]|uniref:Reverse transcriptase n=1 Tax=Phytophthora megakarya TaxID=4795 RepID=A0A225VKC7_9STRA|nr:Reverse transcriptase precursor [Phytophthora megakarya]
MDSLNIAGYADDTAIYILERTMQPTVIQAVDRFSRVSELRLSVKKSTAVRLGNGYNRAKNEDTETRRHMVEKISVVETKVHVHLEETASTRYLGHIVGPEDTTLEAWGKAFKALIVRLTLAVKNKHS